MSAVKQRVRMGKQVERDEKSLRGSAQPDHSCRPPMLKRTKRNEVELAIDDYTGILTAISTIEDVKKHASTLALDQMVMLELEIAK